MDQESKVLICRRVERRNELEIESYGTVCSDGETEGKADDEILGQRDGVAVAACDNRHHDSDVTAEARLWRFHFLQVFRYFIVFIFIGRFLNFQCLAGILRASLRRQRCRRHGNGEKQKQIADVQRGGEVSARFSLVMLFVRVVREANAFTRGDGRFFYSNSCADSESGLALPRKDAAQPDAIATGCRR